MSQHLPGDPETARLQKAYRELQTPGSAECPKTEDLAGMALGEIAGEPRSHIADHIVACRKCSEDYRILLDTHAEASSRLPGARSRLWRRTALAAGVALALAGTVLVVRTLRGPLESPEGAVRSAGPRVETSVAPQSGATLSTGPAEFAWPAQKDAEAYRLKLFTSSGDTLWESQPLRQPTAELPLDRRSLLKTGRSYFWVVEVEMPLGKERLGPFSFTLRR